MRGADPIHWGLALLLLLASSLAAPPAVSAPWPGGAETAIPINGAGNDLSGATWNPVSQSLWVLRQNRQVWEYGFDSGSANFQLIRTLGLPNGIGSDIEACAQVNHAAVDELYTLAENQGRIARVVDLGGSPTVERVWNLEVTNNGNALPPETDGAGPEGLEFVPDSDLLAAGFRYPGGGVFSGSTKGMGGLMFVGHQIDGRLHVFDVNPDVSNDFINHGSFLSSANEIAGLHFDRTSGLMYIWHNPGNNNSLEISTLSSVGSIGTIDTLELYDSGMPTGNLEGIALVTRASCGNFGSANSERVLFLTNDGGNPNLRHYGTFPCDCTGSANEAEFDACAAAGDLSAGCACLDIDLDGDVDCEDFSPAISAQCSVAPICGNGELETGEECDDGNILSGDCCSNVCTLEPLGNSCGDSSDTACSNPDSCDGAGVCLPNHESSVTACGDSGSECVNQDLCDGAGTCTDNGFAAALVACGDSSDTACSNPDSCDGAGVCLPNHESSVTACSDGSACTDGDFCDAFGSCESGLPLDCNDGDVCTTDVCDEVAGCSNTVLLECSVAAPASSSGLRVLLVALFFATATVVLRRGHSFPRTK
jgi:cysteine-rich repeat protein